jgi:hypothetical protein
LSGLYSLLDPPEDIPEQVDRGVRVKPRRLVGVLLVGQVALLVVFEPVDVRVRLAVPPGIPTGRVMIREVALEYRDMPCYQNYSPEKRERMKPYIAKRVDKPVDTLSRDDWNELSSWKFTSLVWTHYAGAGQRLRS